MKTRKSLAMALTIVIALAAGVLLVWQIPPDSLSEDLTGSSPIETTSPMANPAEDIGGADVAAVEELSANYTPSKPRPRRIQCNHGSTTMYGPRGEPHGYSCNRSPYENYSTEALESLAYGDAEAASVLAYRLRHIDYSRALRMATRAAALSGGDVSTLKSATYWRPITNEQGDLDLSGVGQAYVLHLIIERIEDGNYRVPPMYRKQIQQLSDDPDAIFEQLEGIADRMFEEIRQIERDLTGSSTIGGDENA